MIRPNLVRVTAAIVGTMCVAALLMALNGGSNGERNTVRTTLADAKDLEVGNDVRASGVRVGGVDSIKLVDGHAALTLHVDKGLLPLHEDATIRVRPANLLGENYLELDPGTDSKPYLDEAVVPMKQTSSAVSLQDALSTFKAPTAAALASAVTTLGEGLEDNGTETAKAIKALAPAMTRAGDLAKILEGQNDVLDSLVTRLDPVTEALAVDNGKVLDSLLERTTTSLEAVRTEHEALDSTLAQLPGTLDSARRTLAQLGGVADNATPTVKAIKPLTSKLTEITAEIEKFSDAADPALASLDPVLDHANKLLKVAAPEVAQLTASGPDLVSVSEKVRPLSDNLLVGDHLQDVMDFVRKWALSTNGRDSVSHYFRGVVIVTPETLSHLLDSQIPSKIKLPGSDEPTKLPTGAVDDLTDGLLSGLKGLPLLSPGDAKSGGATGLSKSQEKSLLGQLLGGL